jgi:hypothetical protein
MYSKGVVLQSTAGRSNIEIEAQIHKEEHPTGLKLQSVAKSRNAKIKIQLHEVKQNANRKRSLNLDLDIEHKFAMIILSATEKAKAPEIRK